MKIGIVGHGIIGKANEEGFKKVGNSVKIHDLKYKTNLVDLIESEIIYICVPTPSDENSKCDTSIVEDVLLELENIQFKGILAIRSTVSPGFTEKMILKFKNDKICFVPEFLRERCAVEDFIENHEILTIGTLNNTVFQLVKKSHGNLPKNIIKTSPAEAELIKYYNNTLAAAKIIFANIFFEISNKLNCDYDVIKSTFLKTGKCVDLYLDVNNNLRGYAGMCLPKDTLALNELIKELNLDFTMFDSIISDNEKLKKTVFKNMRMN